MARIKGRANQKSRKNAKICHVTMDGKDYDDLDKLAAAENISRAALAERYILAGMYGVQPQPATATEKDLRQKIHDQKMRIEALERQNQTDATEIGRLNREMRELKLAAQNTDLMAQYKDLESRYERALRRIGELSL